MVTASEARALKEAYQDIHTLERAYEMAGTYPMRAALYAMLKVAREQVASLPGYVPEGEPYSE